MSDSEQRPDKNKLLKELTKVLDKEPDLRERVGLFAELLPELEGLSREDIPFQTLIDLWKATIEAEFPKKLRNVFDNLDFAKRKKLFQEGLLRLPCPRFQASLSGWDPILVVDQLLYTTGYHHKPQELLAIAQWLMAAVDLLANRNVEISDISLKRILALASWVWVEINKLSACQPQEARENLWRCYDLVDQYGLIETSSGPPLFDREGDLQAVGTMPSTSLTNFREIMREARVAFLDCDYDKAEKLYEKAEAIARGRDPFHIWFARAGLHDALSALEYKSRSEDDEKEFAHKLGIAKQALSDSETNRRVRRWKELVNQRVQVLQSDQLQDSRRIRLSLHAESSPGCHYSEPNLHQMFRALEHDYAPASLLQRYFHPLFDATPVTSKLVGKSVLSYRLWFGRDSKKTTLALKELLSDSHQTGEERAERDRSIVETALDLSTEQTGAKSRYEIFPIITEFLRDEDTERVKTFFTECKYRPSTLGDEITMWEAVGAFARCTDPETADTVASNLEPNLRGLRTQPNLKKSWLLNPIGAWPWTFWGYTSPRESEKLLSTWMGKYHDTDGFHECFTGIIATWLIAAGRDSLSREGGARMPIQNVLKDWSSERWQNHERWKLFIRIGVGIDPDDTGQNLLKEADETCAERLRAARNLKDPNKRLDLVTQARDFIYMALLCTKEISSALEWLSLYKEERTSEMISNSFFPYDGAIDVRVLGAALYVVEPAERETIIDHILKWVKKSPKTLGHIPRSSLRPEFWGSSWNRLLDLVKELAAAPGLEGREKIHFGLLKAFSLLHQRPCDAEDRPHPELTDLLQQLPPRYVNHRVQDLAAQAISALMTDCGSHPDDLPFAHQIEEATEDPRILVRGVTAYHAERLAKKMSDTKLGELAVKLTAQFAGDPYLFVANQRKLALAEPDYFPEFFRTRREE